jgi:hypothetical protein
LKPQFIARVTIYEFLRGSALLVFSPATFIRRRRIIAGSSKFSPAIYCAGYFFLKPQFIARVTSIYEFLQGSALLMFIPATLLPGHCLANGDCAGYFSKVTLSAPVVACTQVYPP